MLIVHLGITLFLAVLYELRAYIRCPLGENTRASPNPPGKDLLVDRRTELDRVS